MGTLQIRPNFRERVYKSCKAIPKARVSTYKEIAARIGSSPRAVGQALKRNPYAPVVPCHRVVNADGSIGGFNGKTSGKPILKKIKLLEKEGVIVGNGKVKKFDEVFFPL